MSILNLIKKISDKEKEPQSVIAFLFKRQNSLEISILGLKKIFFLNPSRIQEDGFYKINFLNSQIRRIKKMDLEDPEVHDFILKLPKIKMILSRPDEDNNWMAVPDNPPCALKEGITGCKIIYGCENCSYFDHVVCAISQDKNLIYFDHDSSYDLAKLEKLRDAFLEAKDKRKIDIKLSCSKQHQEALRIALLEIKNLIEKDRESLLNTIEGRIRIALQETRASYIGHFVRNNGLVEVRWRSEKGNIYSTMVNGLTLDVIGAGICLSGQDKKFDLISLIGVVNEGETRQAIVVVNPNNTGQYDDEYDDEDD